MHGHKRSYRRHASVCMTMIFIILISGSRAFSQWSVGVSGGFNRNYIYTNTSNRDFTEYKPLSGFSAGIPVSYGINDWFAVNADPSVITKNYKNQRSDFFEGVNISNTNAYLQLPVMAHFTFGGQYLKGFINLGVYGSYWASGRVKGTIPNILNPVDSVTVTNTVYDLEKPYHFSEKYSFDTRRDNRMEFGWLAGLGIAYELNESYQLFAEGRYYQSLTDQQKNYMINQVPRYNQTYGISVGVMYHLSSIRNGRIY